MLADHTMTPMNATLERRRRAGVAALVTLAVLAAPGCQHTDLASSKLAPDVQLVVGEVATRGVLVLDAVEIADRDIEIAIQRRLAGSLGADAEKLTVRAAEGKVTLGGETDNLLSRDTAIAIAATTRGVRDIADRIAIEVPEIGDDALATSIEWALIDEPATNSFDVQVAVEDGAVTLTGRVGSPQERQMAERAARSVHGARSVDNRIGFVSIDRGDGEILTDVQRNLDTDLLIAAEQIEVEVADGKVVLHGTVGSVAERERARELAWVVGVERVFTDDLEIVWWRRDAMARPLAARPDVEAERDLERALALRDDLPRGAVEVDVDGGVVLLRGVVDRWAHKEAALDAVRHTRFAGAVRDDIRVEPTAQVSDRVLEDRIRRRLGSHGLLHDAPVDVEVVGGVAQLVGEVPSIAARRAVATIAGKVDGITDVTNLVSLNETHATNRRGPALAEDVELALSLDPWVDEARVDVAAVGRNVTLTGSVDGPLALIRAMTTAKEAGAATVVPRLELGS